MAEIVGVVASGIAIAQAAGMLLKASIKIKGLLQHVKNIPEETRLLLDKIETLTQTLSVPESLGPDDPPIPAALNGALHTAILQCRSASDQLSEVAQELESEMARARGLKRGLVAVKVALRRDSLMVHEKRLSHAVEVLQVAQLSYMMVLLRMQPRLITSQIVQALGSPNSVTVASAAPLAIVPRIQTRNQAQYAFKDSMRATKIMALGVPWLTGMIEIRRPKEVDTAHKNFQDDKTVAGEGPLIGMRIYLPTWLSFKIVDSVVRQSQFVRTFHLRSFNVHPVRSQAWSLATAAITADDVGMLHRLFENRALTPFDMNDAGKVTLLRVAIESSAWRICNHLLDVGLQFSDLEAYRRSSWEATVDNVYHFGRFIIRSYNNDEEFAWSGFLGHYATMNTAAESLHLRRSFCPDKDYYSETYKPHRLEQFMSFFSSNFGKRDADLEVERLEHAGHILWPGQTERQILPPYPYPYKIHSLEFTWLFLQFAFIAGMKNDILSHWKPLLSDYMASIRLTVGNMPKAYDRRSLLLQLLETLLYPQPFRFDDRRRAILGVGFHARFAIMEVAIEAWLEALASAGVNLREYGLKELTALASGEISGDIYLGDIDRSYYVKTGETRWRSWSNQNTTLRLLGFQYGPSPQDWKLWWTEPTDELVGEFWHRIEGEFQREVEWVPHCPGGWFEDDE